MAKARMFIRARRRLRISSTVAALAVLATACGGGGRTPRDGGARLDAGTDAGSGIDAPPACDPGRRCLNVSTRPELDGLGVCLP